MTKSKRASLIFAVVFVALGILMSSLRPVVGDVAKYERLTDFVLGFATLVLIGVWCKAEAADRGANLSGSLSDFLCGTGS